MFEVNVLTLMPPPEKYLVRKMNHDWVSLLRQKIMLQPNVISTIFPVMINPVQVRYMFTYITSQKGYRYVQSSTMSKSISHSQL